MIGDMKRLVAATLALSAAVTGLGMGTAYANPAPTCTLSAGAPGFITLSITGLNPKVYAHNKSYLFELSGPGGGYNQGLEGFVNFSTSVPDTGPGFYSMRGYVQSYDGGTLVPLSTYCSTTL